MPSTAISAQGSTLQVGNGTGSAKTISGVAVGYPTIITATAHGFANGDVVALAALTGADAALLNGQTVVVKSKTTNTFAVDVDTTGKTITAGSGTATPVQWTGVGNFKTYSGFDGQPTELDVTNMASSAKEIRLGLVDYGQLSLDFDLDNADSGQTVMLAAYAGGLAKQFKLTLPNAATATFTAYVRKFSSSGGVDQIVKRNAELRISGPVTWA
jgi:hypothetical protein